MKVLLLYRPKSEHERKVEEFMRDFSKVYPDHTINLLSLDTREGVSTASLYDVMQYPAVLALTNDGHLLKDWQGGGQLPLMGEVAYYAQ